MDKGEPRAINGFKVGDYFYLSEFQCPCCHTVKLVPYLVWMLDKLRKKINAPIIITSGYRCPKHNEKIGGAKNSYHMRGMAADIYSKKYSPDELGRYAEEIDFDTIIVYHKKGFIHLDIRKNGLGLIRKKS